jgi:hypothetical protein
VEDPKSMLIAIFANIAVATEPERILDTYSMVSTAAISNIHVIECLTIGGFNLRRQNFTD